MVYNRSRLDAHPPSEQMNSPTPFIPVYSGNKSNVVLKKRSRNTTAIISKENQKGWLKIKCVRVSKANKCCEGLQGTCGGRALPYRTVTRWVKSFEEGRPIILHNNARAHAAGAVTDLLNRWCWEVLYNLLILRI